MRRFFIYEQPGWPRLTWDAAALIDLLAEVRYGQGRLLGQMEGLGPLLREDATLQMLTQEVIKTSEIEGEQLNAADVRSALARRMGLADGRVPTVDRRVEGIVEVILDATHGYGAPLTKERLCSWQAALFPTGRSGLQKITVGDWRTDAHGPMQVVSGSYGREKVHYEAPAHGRLEQEIARFLEFINAPAVTDPVLKSAVAHFWFVTIHPFDDGNGRIARVIAEMMLARAEGSSQRLYSMAPQIHRERAGYYDILERCQRGSLDISPWIEWYLRCLKRALSASGAALETVLAKAIFWKSHAGEPFNERQQALLKRLLDGFEGKLTSTKWAALAKCSQDTAWRDIGDLVSRGILAKDAAGGRSTGYHLAAQAAEHRSGHVTHDVTGNDVE
jgi:Fic family protein